MSSESTETPRLVSVMNGSACVGFLISLGARGVEAFGKDEKSLGVFPDATSAATAVGRHSLRKFFAGVAPFLSEDNPMTNAKAGPSSYSRRAHFELRLPGNRLRCGGCGHRVSAHAFDVIEPGLIRAVCTHCHEDLITIEMR
jgi:hypothetical protein